MSFFMRRTDRKTEATSSGPRQLTITRQGVQLADLFGMEPQRTLAPVDLTELARERRTAAEHVQKLKVELMQAMARLSACVSEAHRQVQRVLRSSDDRHK
jgi:hypothetical protein